MGTSLSSTKIKNFHKDGSVTISTPVSIVRRAQVRKVLLWICYSRMYVGRARLRLVRAMQQQLRRHLRWHVGREMEYVVRTCSEQGSDLPSLAIALLYSPGFGTRENVGNRA